MNYFGMIMKMFCETWEKHDDLIYNVFGLADMYGCTN